MSSLRRSLFGLFSIVVVLGLSLAASGQEYKVKLTRPQKVDDTFTISATGTAKENVTVDLPGGAPPEKHDSNYTIDLDGTVKVLAVDANGQVTKLQCTVDKCEKDGKPLFDKGTVIIAENKESKTVYTVNDSPIDPKAGEALQGILETHDASAPTDDAMFGTNDPQKVGASWPINSETTAASMSKQGIPIKKDDITGKTTLAGVKQVDGKDVLQLEGEVNVKGLKSQIPDGPKIDNADLAVTMSGMFPADDTAHMLSQTMSMKVNVKTTSPTPDGQVATATVIVDRTVKLTFGDVKK